MFIKEDIYTTSSALKLYNCWTDKVTKFDSSAFYNWEQDNMPIYDLEERTYYLWEKMGFPTSSIPGVALVVSADAPDSAITCNKNIYRTVSAAVNALPEMINFPIIVEIANFGDLGDLVLNNLKFGPKGSLEIINRNFAHQYADASTVVFFGGANVDATWRFQRGYRDETAGNVNNFASALNVDYEDYANNSFYSIYWGHIFPIKTHFAQASCLSISASVFSGVNIAEPTPNNDLRWDNKFNGFVSLAKNVFSNQPAPIDLVEYYSKHNKSHLILSKNKITDPNPTYHDTLVFKTYDLNPDASDNITTHDASCIDELNNNNNLYLTRPDPGSNGYNSLFYCNSLNKLVINNCEGPIYIRNFFLDGGSYSKTNNNYGIEVNNSKNIYLENNVVCRYRKAGVLFNNSNVTLLRGLVATRNYDFDSSNNRITGAWASKRIYNSFDVSGKKISNIDSGAGLIANNSYINFSSTREFEESIQNSHIVAKTQPQPVPIVKFKPYVNKNYIFEFSNNPNGIILNNSTLVGGEISMASHMRISNNHLLNTVNIDLFNNTECGLRCWNSKISFDGRFNFLENLFGAKLDSSVFEVDKIGFIFNQKTAFELTNSKVLYNKNLIPYCLNGSNNEDSPLNFSANGQHLVLNNSKMVPAITSGMDSVYDESVFDNTIALRDPDSDLRQIVPAIEVTNNSELVLISPKLKRDADHSVDEGSYVTCRGSELAVTNGSNATIKGTRYFANRIFGPAGRGYHNNLAGIYAGKNSTVEINGPTVVANYGVDLLAEKNSTININPHRSEDAGLDVSSFNLEDVRNHTAVELHATRSCIVVDQNSNLNVRDLGSFTRSWESGNYLANREGSGISYHLADNISKFVSGGGLQFYPNPIPPVGDPYNTNFPGVDNLTMSQNSFNTNTNPGLYYFTNQSTTPNFDFSAYTNGGFCVRAFNNSIVNVHNVNFPAGWWNCSAPYYDNTIAAVNGGLCYKTFIWNIGDNSKLNASYLSVSTLYPAAAGYHGPYGMWTSGTGNTGILSGLPSSTPDTSSVSILDFYGISPASATPFPRSTQENYGPFRLYLSVDPVVNVLSYASGPAGYNVINQIYAQGYQPSGNMICSAVAASSLHLSLLQKNSSNVYVASGYYYGSSFHKTANFQNIYLDESAANTFANAKHCAVGKSGNVKLVSIHYPYYNIGIGEDYNNGGVFSFNSFDLQKDN